MTNPIRIVFTLALSFLTFICYSQTEEPEPSEIVIHYGYDAAGNRISKTIVITPVQDDEDSTAEGADKSNTPFDGEISVYPNPTYGLVNIQISEELIKNQPKGQFKARLEVFDTSGKRVLRDQLSTSLSEIDLSQKAAGTYIAKLTIGKESQSWRIKKTND